MGLFLVDPIAQTTRRVDDAVPAVFGDDLAAVRGDGIFEAAMVRDGVIRQRQMHLDRFERSARLLDLDGAASSIWGPAIDVAATESLREFEGDFLLKWILSRGREIAGDTQPHGWILTDNLPALPEKETRKTAVVTLSRGMPAGIGSEAPWLLVGAKSLSYAVVMAATRFAKTRGADEALWMTTDGFVLEAPRANLVLAQDGVLLSPDPCLGLLHGTTQREMFARAAADGWQCRYARLRLDDIFRSDAAWLTSSTQLALPIGQINDMELRSDPTVIDWMYDLMKPAVCTNCDSVEFFRAKECLPERVSP